MEFCKDRVFTALNADELKPGDKVIVADCLDSLRKDVELNEGVCELKEVLGENIGHRFSLGEARFYALAYLVERKENCTNCEGKVINCMKGRANDEVCSCKDYTPKTEKKAEEKNCYNCRLTYTRDGVMRCMMNDQRCNNPEVACNHYEPTTFEKHYRPFRDTDELIKTWCEKGGKWQKRELTMPHIWIKHKYNLCHQASLITGFFDNQIIISGEKIESFEVLFNDWMFADGSPCGVEE